MIWILNKIAIMLEKMRTLVLLFIFILVAFCSCGNHKEEKQDCEGKDVIMYELASIDDDFDEQIIQHIGYTVSYNDKRHIPNWVAYQLTKEETEGEEERSDDFFVDPMVKGVAVEADEYKHSGYDRGHMAPAGDMKWSEQAMHESFYMTNICPQNSNNNRGDWKSLEELARDWACKYGSIYICCGPIVENEETVIGHGLRIVVPQAFYKVFLRREEGSWYSIGFVMENKAQDRPLMTYAVTVDEIEEKTGIDFFYQLPDSIEKVVEADFDFADWSVN